MGAKIGVVGSSNVDLVTRIDRMPEAGETLAARGFDMGNGGKGANQAVAAAKLGADVFFVTRVGADSFGRELLEAYKAAGIDTRHARTVPGLPTGTATILVEPSGENRILIDAGANQALGPEAIDAAAADLRGCDLIVLQLETPLDGVYRALDIAAGAGIPLLLNPAPAHPDLDVVRIATATFLVPNQGELALLTGLPTSTRDEAEAAARALAGRGIGTIIVTLGADGVLIVTAGSRRHVPAIQVTPRDTTGAGDAFVGAFSARWTAMRDLDRAVAQAVRYAADSITRPGAQASYASRADFDAFCAELDSPDTSP